MIEKTFIGGYWYSRPETAEAAAKAITRFLLELRKVDEIFSIFRLPAMSRKEAMSKKFNLSVENIQKVLAIRRKDDIISSEGYCNIGFSMRLFNEVDEDISFTVSFTIGLDDEDIPNVCYVDIDGIILGNEKRNKIVELITEIFSPETIRNE